MQIDQLAVRLRLGTPLQAADVGVQLCQHAARSVYRCYLAVLLPLAVLCAASVEVAGWLPPLLLWLSKPWLDRSILFALSRATFGAETSLRDLWDAQRHVWWSQWWRTWTLLRLSGSRATRLPVVQLEQQRGANLRKRLRQLLRGRSAVTRLVTFSFSNVEAALVLGASALWLLFAPKGISGFEFLDQWSDASPRQFALLAGFLPYLLAVAFLEPFHVSAGFGLYLNRRVELEAWDLEQDLRHAFAR